MKAILLMMLLLLPARAEEIYNLMDDSYGDIGSLYSISTEDHGLDNGEVYHWDNLYLCTYCYNTEVVLELSESEYDIRFNY